MLGTTVAIYFSIFYLSYLIIKYVDITSIFPLFERFLKSGMSIHLIMALGMIYWGINILCKEIKNTKAYLFLLIPCPLCMIVIFLTLSFLFKFIGKYNIKYLISFYFIFLAIQIFTLILLDILTRWYRKVSFINFLGYTLIFIGIYFLLVYLLAPQIGQLTNIYRLSMHSNLSHKFSLKDMYIIISSLIIILFGYFHKRNLIK
ncbi:hypothetical protein JCM13304A_15480 [Desulfothermus okinawensis JCM 13304]